MKQNRVGENGEFGLWVKEEAWGTFEQNDLRGNGREGVMVTSDCKLRVVMGGNLLDAKMGTKI